MSLGGLGALCLCLAAAACFVGAAEGGGALALLQPVLAIVITWKHLTEIATHILAFLLFVWVLKRFAWAPLLKTIDERKAKIEGDFKKAEELHKEAEEVRERYEAQLRDIEEKARKEMQKAIDEGKRIAQEIQQKAREDAENILERARQNTGIELANARKQLRKDVVELTLAATERVLREQIDRTAHQRHIERYIDDLGGLQ
ncbi:MAG: F0F1 ATP synthase subunit B [Polyangia bacterium]|jgi:F-type H+-transporting ATPase subunit b|nr:F0F1 ATP synthase subunit B [Polyangia bacterium]